MRYSPQNSLKKEKKISARNKFNTLLGFSEISRFRPNYSIVVLNLCRLWKLIKQILHITFIESHPAHASNNHLSLSTSLWNVAANINISISDKIHRNLPM